MSIADAPWITETERTGHYRFGWWNQPQEDDAIICDRCGEMIDTSGDWFNIDGEILDATAEHGYIEVGDKVKVSRFENAQLFVKKM